MAWLSYISARSSTLQGNQIVYTDNISSVQKEISMMDNYSIVPHIVLLICVLSLTTKLHWSGWTSPNQSKNKEITNNQVAD